MRRENRLGGLIQAFTSLIERASDEKAHIFEEGEKLLSALVNQDD